MAKLMRWIYKRQLPPQIRKIQVPDNWRKMVDFGVPPVFYSDDNPFAEVLDLWWRNPEAWLRSFNIVTKELEHVAMQPTELQVEAFKHIVANKKSQILKGRQIFATTTTATFVLRECLYKPGTRAAVAVNDDRNAVEVGKFYMDLHRMHPLLPTLMPRTNDSAHMMEFANGSQIQFGTANSEFWRSRPVQIAHLTEAALYDNLGKTLSSLGQAVPKSGYIIMESTANGENAYFQIWDDEKSPYAKLFLSWIRHPEYVSDAPLPENLTEFESDFIKRYKLTVQRASWWVEKFRSLPIEERALVGQEYPPVPSVAFIMSGDKFLKTQIPVPPAAQPDADGVTRFAEYNPQHEYVAGVDVASGSTSATADASTVVIGDKTTREVVATMQAWLPTPLFASRVYALLSEYKLPVTAVEITGGYGLDVARDLRELQVPMYLRTVHRGVADKVVAEHGWDTNTDTRPILYGGIFNACNGPKDQRWIIPCKRLVTELNQLAYTKNKRPEAPKHKHDDMATAFGCMIQALPQAHPAEKRTEVKPVYLTPIQREWKMIEERGIAAVNAMRTDSASGVRPGDFYD